MDFLFSDFKKIIDFLFFFVLFVFINHVISEILWEAANLPHKFLYYPQNCTETNTTGTNTS